MWGVGRAIVEMRFQLKCLFVFFQNESNGLYTTRCIGILLAEEVYKTNWPVDMSRNCWQGRKTFRRKKWFLFPACHKIEVSKSTSNKSHLIHIPQNTYLLFTTVYSSMLHPKTTLLHSFHKTSFHQPQQHNHSRSTPTPQYPLAFVPHIQRNINNQTQLLPKQTRGYEHTHHDN